MDNRETFGILGQQKLENSNQKQELQRLEKNQEVKAEIDTAKALNKHTTGKYEIDRYNREILFNNHQDVLLQKAGVQKYYADKEAYDRARIDRNYDTNVVQQGGITAPGLSMLEQQLLGSDSSKNQLLTNDINRRKQIDLQLQHNQNQYDKFADLLNIDREQFYKQLRVSDYEYNKNIEAAKLANAPFQNMFADMNTFLSSKDGRFDTSYWAALQDGAAGFADSVADLGGTLFHFLANGNLEDYDPINWFQRNFGGNYASQYSSPLSNESWLETANFKNFVGMGIQSIPEMIGMIASMYASGGATALARVPQLTSYLSKMSGTLRAAGKLEQAAFLGMVAKALPVTAQWTTMLGIEGHRRGLQIASDRKEIYNGKFNYGWGDFATGVASSGLDYATMLPLLKGVGTHWNKITSKLAVIPQEGIAANIRHNAPKVLGGMITNTAPGILVEGGTEFIQTALEMSRIHDIDLTDFIDVMSSDNAKYNGIKHQLLDAMAVGGMMGGAFSVIGQANKGIRDTYSYAQDKKAIAKAEAERKGDAEVYYATSNSQSSAEVASIRQGFSNTINKLFENNQDISIEDKKQFKDKADKLNHSLTEEIIKKGKEAELNQETNPKEAAKNLEERKHLARAYDKIRMNATMLSRVLPFEATNKHFDTLLDIINNSKLSPAEKETNITNEIVSFIKDNPEVNKEFKTILARQSKKDLVEFFKQFDIEIDIPEAKTKDNKPKETTNKESLPKEEKERREKLLQEALETAEKDLDIDIGRTPKKSEEKAKKEEDKPQPKKTNKRRTKLKKPTKKDENVKNQQNIPLSELNEETATKLADSSPIVQEENNLELVTDKIQVKEKEAQEVVNKIVNYLGETPEGIKKLLEYKTSQNKDVTTLFPKEIKELSLKNNSEIKKLFEDKNLEISDEDIKIIKQMAIQIEFPTPKELYNDTISLDTFRKKINTLHSLNYKLMDLTFENTTSKFADFKSQEIASIQTMIEDELDYFTNFLKHNLSDYHSLENSLNEFQKEHITKQLFMVANNLELLNSNYEKLLNITHQDTRKLFKIIPNKEAGLIERILKYIISLVERFSSLGRMLSQSLAKHKFKNKEELEYSLDTLHQNMLKFQEHYSSMKEELNNFKALNKEIKNTLESSPLLLNADGTSKTFKIGNSDIFLTKKSQQNLQKYLPILNQLDLLNYDSLDKKFLAIRDKLDKVSSGTYKDDHLNDFSYSGLTKLLNSSYILNERGQISKIDRDIAEGRNLIAQASVISVLNALSRRENDKHNLSPETSTLISSKEIDKEIIRSVEDILNVDIDNKDVQLGITSLGFLMLEEANKSSILDFKKYSFSEQIYNLTKRLIKSPIEKRLSILQNSPIKWKEGIKLDVVNNTINARIRDNRVNELMDYLQSNTQLDKNYRKNPDSINNSYFEYPISKISIYSLILEQAKIEKALNNNLENKFLPLEKPIYKKYASRVVNERNQSKFSFNSNVKNILLKDLDISLEDIEEVPSINKSNINALKKEYLNQGNLVNTLDIMNPHYYFPIFNTKNSEEDIKYYRFKDLDKYTAFLNKLGFEDTLTSSVSVLRGSELVDSFQSKIREENTDIGELLTILLFPENYHQDFYFEFEEQNQQRLQVKTNLFNPQRNKLLRPLIELKEWYHNNEMIPQTTPKLYSDMTQDEKDGIVQALALIITRDSYDKPSQYNSETGMLEYKFDETFPTRESIAQALETEEGRNKLLPYLDKRSKKLVLNDEPFNEINAFLLKEWFENGFKEFNPNNLLIELDGRSTAVFEQALHSNANKNISDKLGLVKGYIDSNPIENMIKTSSKPIFKEKNNFNDVVNALANDYPYGNTMVKALETLSLKNITTPKSSNAANSKVYNKTDFRDTQSPSGYVNHTGGALGADSYWTNIGEQFGVVSNHYIGENTPTANTSFKPTNISNTLLKEYDKELVEINNTFLGRYYPTKSEIGNNLLRRDMVQVDNADAIFAVGTITLKGEKTPYGEVKFSQVEGGAGWAVAKAMKDKKPVYIFDQERNSWYKAVYKEDGKKSFKATETPTLTPHFAGIGTSKLKENGKKAIEAVYAKTFGKEVKPITQSNTPYSYEVSTEGDKRFSALVAKFNPDTLWNDYNIGNMTIEEVYQNIVKQSGKNKPPKETSIVYNPNLKTKEEREDYSYQKGYLPLWKLWAEQNPKLIEELTNKIRQGAILTDSFAKTKVSQARALNEIILERDNYQEQLNKLNPKTEIKKESNEVEYEPIKNILTKNPYIDTLLSLTDTSLYTTKDYLNAEEASKMYKTLRDISKKFLIPIAYGSKVDSVIESTSSDSLYNYIIETFSKQLASVISIYNPTEHKDFKNFLNGLLNPNSQILNERIKNPTFNYHIRQVLDLANKFDANETNIGSVLDYYLDNKEHIGAFHTLGNVLNLKDIVEINKSIDIDSKKISKIRENLDKLETNFEFSFSEILKHLLDNKLISKNKDGSLYFNITDKESPINKKILQNLGAGGWLKTLSKDEDMRSLVRYLYKNPSSYTEVETERVNPKTRKTETCYTLKMKNGFMYDALQDYSKSVEMRSAASKIMAEARNIKFSNILEEAINKSFEDNLYNTEMSEQEKFQQGIIQGLEDIDKFLDTLTRAENKEGSINPTDSFSLSKIKENVSNSELLSNEENLKGIIAKLYEEQNLTFNSQVMTNFVKRGEEQYTTERFSATITRIAAKTAIHLIEHNLEAWVMGGIMLDSPVTMSIYDAGIVTLPNAKKFQNGWNKNFESGPKEINLYSLPMVLMSEYSDTLKQAIDKYPNEWNTIVRNTNYIYPIEFNNIMQGGTETNPYNIGDIKSYTIKNNPFNPIFEKIREFDSSNLPFLHKDNSLIPELVKEIGQENVDNARYLDNNILLLPNNTENIITSTTQSMKLGTLYNKLQDKKIDEKEFFTELNKEIDKGLILPYTFGSVNNKQEKNDFIRQAVIKASKGLDFNGDMPITDNDKPQVKNQRNNESNSDSREITIRDIENSETLIKEEMFQQINEYIDSLDGLQKTISRNIFNKIVENLPENLQFLYNPNITTKGAYIQDKNNHYIIIGNNSSSNTLLHEIIHASINDAMNRKTISAKNIISDVTRIMNYVRHRLENNPDLMSELNFVRKDGTINQVYEDIFIDNDISEFLAYFLTDKEKLEFLNNEKSKDTLKGIMPANMTIVGKTFFLLGSLIKSVLALLQPDKWKNYNAYSTLDETLANKLTELSDFNKDENYQRYKDKTYVKVIDSFNDFGRNLLQNIFKSSFSDIETYAKANNISEGDIITQIREFQQEFINENIHDGETLKKFVKKIINPKNMMNPIKRRAIWELFGMFNNTQAEGLFKFICQVALDFQLLSKNSATGKSLREAESLSNIITYNMSQEQMGYDITKKKINDILKETLGEKWEELELDERTFKQPSVEELKDDVYNRKQYSRKTQLERDIGEILYNLKLSDALNFGYNKEVSNEEIQTLLNDTLFASKEELDSKLQEIMNETKANLFNLIGKRMKWETINDVPTNLMNYISNSTSILGYSRLSRQTSRAGFTNVEDIMRKIKDTPLVGVYYALSENIKPSEKGVDKKYIAIRNQYHNFFNSMKKLTTYQAIKAMNSDTKIGKYHRLKKENLIKEFGMKNEITEPFNVLMTTLLTLHSSYAKRSKTMNRYTPNDESRIIALQNEYNSLIEKNENPEKQKVILKEINEIELQSYTRFNDFRDADFRESYYLDYRVPYAINTDISLKTIEYNRDASYYGHITNNRKITTQEEAIDFLQNLGYRFIDMNGKISNTRDFTNPNVTMRYDGFNKYEDTRVNIAYLGSSEMAAGNLLSDSSLSLEEQDKVKELAIVQMQKEISSLIDNTWEFDEAIFDNSYSEYRPIGNSTKEFRTLTGRLTHNNMTEVDTRISELLANENKEIVRNTTIEKVNVDLARALIKDNEMFRTNELYQHQIKTGKYVKVFDLENPQNIDKDFYGKLSSEAFMIFKKVLHSYNENKAEGDKLKELYINPLTTTYLFGFKNSKFTNVITQPKFRRVFNALETAIESLFRENKTNVIIRNPKVVLANGLSNLMSLTGLGYPIDTILNSIEPLQEELKHYKKMQKELFDIENNIILLQDLETLEDMEKIELDNLIKKKERLQNSMSKSRVHIPMQNGFDTNIIDETLQELDSMDNLHLQLESILPKSFIESNSSKILNEIMMTSNSEYYQNLQNLNRLGDIIPKILAYEFALEEGKSDIEAIRFAQDYFVNYNIPITSPFLRGVERSGAGFFLKWGLRTQKIAAQSFLNKPFSTLMSLVMSNILAPSLISPVGGESFITKGLPLGQSLDISNYFRWGFIFK